MRDFLHVWTITEVIPNQKLIYNWKYENLVGDSYVTFELTPLKEVTQLTLTTKVVADFPDDIPEFKRESCIGGWNYFIKKWLYNYLLKIG